jgi:hypothetical protein
MNSDGFDTTVSERTYLLDVILPFHKIDAHLSEAIDSCMKALPKNSRIIAVNTCNSGEIGGSYPSSIHEVFLRNGSYLEALGLGILSAKATFIALMNSDDLSTEDRFHKQIFEMIRTQSDLSVCNISKFSVSSLGRKRHIPALLGSPPKKFSFALLLLGSYRADASWCFTSQWAKKNTVFLHNDDISDWCTAMRINGDTKVSVIDEDLYQYRMHPEQVTRNTNDSLEKQFYDIWQAFNESLGFMRLTNSEIQCLILPWKSTEKLQNLKNIKIWLGELEQHLMASMRGRDRVRVASIFARRRVTISFYQRRSVLIGQDYFFIPKIFIQYLRFRKQARR